ncbi:MAG: SUMF1/EgtB/PvdO family nonheme iron enzyme [Chloroflexota bacterium]
MTLALTRSDPSRVEATRERFVTAWARTDRIFEMIASEEFERRPIVWRHPFIFYVGHLPAFSWNQICGALLQWKSFNPYFDELFCRGIDPDVDTGECHWHPEVPQAWPCLADTIEYCDRVRGAILESVEAIGGHCSNDLMAQNGRAFQMVLEHEYMHQETLIYMLQQVPLVRKRRSKFMPAYSFQAGSLSQAIAIPAGRARLGARMDEIPFGWDNEFNELTVDVPSFKIESLPVTNGAFYDFVESGGYEDERHWQREDWLWRKLEGKKCPTCWFQDDGGWFYRSMFDSFPLERVRDWPVYVSLAEARAYARWSGKRLPTEAEFHRAAYYGPDERETRYPWGNAAPGMRHSNFDFSSWSPLPVGSRPAGASRWGILELVGNGWELTDTPLAPFPGFSPYIESYPEYSRDFFDGKHFVVKGASWATDANLLRASFRNWYQAHYPYVFAKFRCVS